MKQEIEIAFDPSNSFQSLRNTIAFFNSPKLKRYILYGIILVSTCTSLFLLAAIAYMIIYIVYIPRASLATDLDFNFPSSNNAFAIVDLLKIPISRQVDYNVHLQLDLPRTTHNQEIGNFMVRASFVNNFTWEQLDQDLNFPVDRVYHGLPKPFFECIERKMAIMPYKSTLLEYCDTLVFLPLYILNLKSQHSILRIPFQELTKPVPEKKHILIEMDRIVNMKSAQLIWTVKWRGIRYLMYNYRLFMFAIGTWSFWTVEIIAMIIVAYLVISKFGGSNIGGENIASDTVPDNNKFFHYATVPTDDISGEGSLAEPSSQEISPHSQSYSDDTVRSNNGVSSSPLSSSTSSYQGKSTTEKGESEDEPTEGQLAPQEPGHDIQRSFLTPEPTPELE